jgi:hypothetical protein
VIYHESQITAILEKSRYCRVGQGSLFNRRFALCLQFGNGGAARAGLKLGFG